MRLTIPPLREHVDDLRHRLQREHDGQKKPRLQMLYLLASGQAHNRQEVAALLGVHRNTIGRWLALYAAGGLDALLATYPKTATRTKFAAHRYFCDSYMQESQIYHLVVLAIQGYRYLGKRENWF